MPDGEQKKWFDLDLAVMADEALVVLAEECEYGPARDELIVRYDAQVDRLMSWLGRSHHLTHSDVEDARQSAVFWIVEAIKKFDTEQINKVRRCSFRSFVYRVLIARFKDYAKHLRRVECHYDRSTECAVETASGEDGNGEPEDPARIAEAQESLNRLQQTLTSLDSDSGRLWQLLASGTSLRQIATELKMSYDSAKRRRRKLLERLKGQLNPAADQSA
jgi:RNA polymerase sigma factor (sigma-70 family)